MTKYILIFLLLASPCYGANLVEQDTSNVLKALPNETELVSERTETFKKFYAGKNEYRVAGQVGAIHYKEDYKNLTEQWKEIDLTPVDMGNYLLVEKAPNIIKIYKDKVGYEVESRRGGGKWSVEFQDAKHADVDFEVIPRTDGVRLWKHIKSANAPIKYKWKITKLNDLPGLKLRETPLAFDGNNNEVEIKTTKTPIDTKSFYWEEEVGELKDKSKTKTYILHIDTDITEEQTGASADDQRDAGGTWPGTEAGALNANYVSFGADGGSYYCCGARFQTVPVPQGATITSANTKWYPYASYTTTCGVTITFDDVDDSAQFDTGGGKCSSRTSTSDYVDWTVGNWTDGVWVTSPDCTDPVQEVVSRASWAENNDMSVLVRNTLKSLTAGNKYRIAHSWDETGNVLGPKLNISYTSGGGAYTAQLIFISED